MCILARCAYLPDVHTWQTSFLRPGMQHLQPHMRKQKYQDMLHPRPEDDLNNNNNNNNNNDNNNNNNNK